MTFVEVAVQVVGSATSAESVTAARSSPSGVNVTVCVPWPPTIEPLSMCHVTGSGVWNGTDAA